MEGRTFSATKISIFNSCSKQRYNREINIAQENRKRTLMSWKIRDSEINHLSHEAL